MNQARRMTVLVFAETPSEEEGIIFAPDENRYLTVRN